MNTFDYRQYEKEHLKPVTYRVFTIISLFWFFLSAAIDASAAARASDALKTAAGAGYSPEDFGLNFFQFIFCFILTLSSLNNSLFYMKELGQEIPLLSKYRFAPVEMKKIYRAKAFLLLRGTCIFYVLSLVIYFTVAVVVFGGSAPFLQLAGQFAAMLLFCIAAAAVTLLTDWHRYRRTLTH